MSGPVAIIACLGIGFVVVVVEEIVTWRRWNRAFRETIEKHRGSRGERP